MFKSINRLWALLLDYIRNLLNMPEISELMNEKFDMVMFEGMLGDPFLGFAAHFKCPSVAIQSFESQKQFNDMFGNPTYFSFVPSLVMGIKGRMTFIERVLNYLTNIYSLLLMNYSFEPVFSEIYE